MRESGELTTGSMIVKKEVEEVIPDSAEISELTGELDKKIEIFGHNLFNKKELSFEPNLSIATPDNYKLGPGDEVIIDVWGASQSTFRDYISPDGYINIDKIGPHYQLVVRREDKFKDTLEIKVELLDASVLENYGELEKLIRLIQERIKSVLGLQAKITLVPPKTLERFQGKAKRILDLRNQ